MSASDLTTTLLSCQNPDPAVRTAAEAALASAEQNNLAEFFLALAQELATEGKDVTVRQLAGLHFKNLLVAKDDTLQSEKHEKWKTIPAQQRSVIKSVVIGTIRSPVPVARHTVSRAPIAAPPLSLLSLKAHYPLSAFFISNTRRHKHALKLPPSNCHTRNGRNV
jgi:hypothetical protein